MLLTTVGKILFNDIMPEGLPYLQEPTNANLTEGVPAKYFLPLGGDIKEAIRNLELNPPFKKKNLGISSLKSSNVSVRQKLLPYLTV